MKIITERIDPPVRIARRVQVKRVRAWAEARSSFPPAYKIKESA